MRQPDINNLDPLILMYSYRRSCVGQRVPGTLQEFLQEKARNWYQYARNRSRKPVLLPDDLAHCMPSQATCDYFNKGIFND